MTEIPNPLSSNTDPRSILNSIGANSKSPQIDIDAENSPYQILKLAPLNPAENLQEWDRNSTKHFQDLAAQLQQMESDLQRQQSQLDQEVENWKKKSAAKQAALDQQYEQLQQQSSQVRCQQNLLIQLQSDIVESYENTKIAIETLVTEQGSDTQTVSALKALKFEIFGRFDYISRRWNQLHKSLQEAIDQETSEKSIDDSADWAA